MTNKQELIDILLNTNKVDRVFMFNGCYYPKKHIKSLITTFRSNVDWYVVIENSSLIIIYSNNYCDGKFTFYGDKYEK